jgi:hypothetical protein
LWCLPRLEWSSFLFFAIFHRNYIHVKDSFFFQSPFFSYCSFVYCDLPVELALM